MSVPLLLLRRIFVALLGLMLAAGATAQSGPQPTLPTARLNAGIHIITAELATTPQSRKTGMMFREKTAPNHGMLFVFDGKAQQCFWMRNTPLPLSIAFIDDDGTILQLNDMAPKSDDDALLAAAGPLCPRNGTGLVQAQGFGRGVEDRRPAGQPLTSLL